jgi:hypothetical protein
MSVHHRLLATLLLVLGACARDPSPRPAPPTAEQTTTTSAALAAPNVPDPLKAAADERVATKAAARGVQIYACEAKGGDGFAWKLVGPDAVLTDPAGRPFGRHYAGPTWESVDGSKVVGELSQKVDAPDGQGIPWLLLQAKSSEGTGALAKVTSIQRVDTVGGRAPASGCDAPHVGAQEKVPYQANYYFYSGIR